MINSEKIEELTKDYRFYIRCKRVVWKKPRLVYQIDNILSGIGLDVNLMRLKEIDVETVRKNDK